MRFLYLIILAVLVMCPAMGCGGEDGDGTAKDAAGMVEKAGEQIGAALDSFKKETFGKLDEYEGGLSKIKEGAKQLNNDELNNTVDGISEKIKDVRDSVTGLNVDKLEDLKDHKSKLMTKLDEIKTDLGKAQGLFDKLKDKLPEMPGK